MIVLLIGTSALRSVATYATNRWMSMRGHSLARRLLESYMRQPYVFFLDQHNAHLSTNLLSETQRVVSSAYRPLADLISSGLTFVLIVTLLLWVEPVVTLLSVVVLGGLYSLRVPGDAAAAPPAGGRDAQVEHHALQADLGGPGRHQAAAAARAGARLPGGFSKPSLEYARATAGAAP